MQAGRSTNIGKTSLQFFILAVWISVSWSRILVDGSSGTHTSFAYQSISESTSVEKEQLVESFPNELQGSTTNVTNHSNKVLRSILMFVSFVN